MSAFRPQFFTRVTKYVPLLLPQSRAFIMNAQCHIRGHKYKYIQQLQKRSMSVLFNSIDKSECNKQNNIDGYWIGPYGVRIANIIDHVIAEDGINTLHQNGKKTEIGCMGCDMTEQEYKDRYAILDKNGHYYYSVSPIII